MTDTADPSALAIPIGWERLPLFSGMTEFYRHVASGVTVGHWEGHGWIFNGTFDHASGLPFSRPSSRAAAFMAFAWDSERVGRDVGRPPVAPCTRDGGLSIRPVFRSRRGHA